MLTRFIAAALLSLLTACSAYPPDPQVRDARIVASPKGGAAYFTVQNDGSADQLVDVAAPGLGDASLHTTSHADGVMRMRRVDALGLPEKGTLELKPGGNHVMILGDKVTPGTKARLVLTFEKAGTRSVEAPIQSIGMAEEAHH